eukprot:14188621-Alexandrium_andersonii.AAC.1
MRPRRVRPSCCPHARTGSSGRPSDWPWSAPWMIDSSISTSSTPFQTVVGGGAATDGAGNQAR